MPVDRSQFVLGNFSGVRRGPVEQPTFAQTVGATIGYTYDPAYEFVRNKIIYGSVRQKGYNPLTDMEGYEQYAVHLTRAVSPEHMVDLKRGIDESNKRRQVLASSSLASQFFAGLYDPINIIALPLGGPTVGALRSAARVGVGVGALQAGVEVGLIQPFDPLQTAKESAINIVSATLFGGALGGVASIPISRRARALTAFEQDLVGTLEFTQKMEFFRVLTTEDLTMLNQPSLRLLGLVDGDELSRNRTDAYNNIDVLRQNPWRSGSADEIEVQKAYINSIEKELALRDLEEGGYNKDNALDFAINAFTDSPLYKLLSTPFKRLIQSPNAPAKLKEYAIRLAGDSALIHAYTSVLGVASTQSVHARASMRRGQVAAAYDNLHAAYREAYGLKDTRIFDIDMMNTVRKAFDYEGSFEGFLRGVSEKRVKNLPFTDSEKKAAKIIDDFFKNAERELYDLGLIGETGKLKQRLQSVEQAIFDVNEQLKASRQTPNAPERQALTSKLERLLSDKGGIERELGTALNNAPRLTDNWYARFYNKKKIKKEMSAVVQIFEDHYRANPEVWVLKEGEWVKEPLPADPVSINKRAKDTVAAILEEDDLLSVVAGTSRKKHFNGRIDIPTEKVWDYIIQDPINVMRAYSARISPTVEFNKAFGGRSIQKVDRELREELALAGVKEDEANKMMSDFLHLYDSIAGIVLKEPDRWDNKIAFGLRKLAELNYMGSAWLSAFPDTARIIAEHDLNNMSKAINLLTDKDMRPMLMKDARLSGEALDFFHNSVGLRLMEDLMNDPSTQTIWDTATSAFYVLNGLTPMTQALKVLDGIVTGHEIIDTAIKYTKGEATKQDLTKMLRYGISVDEMEKIAKSPWIKTDNGLYIPNTQNWEGHISIPALEELGLKVVDIDESGSTRVGMMGDGVYQPIVIDTKKNILRFDREYIEGDEFDAKPWFHINQLTEGRTVFPEDAFATPKDWSNFRMLRAVEEMQADIQLEAAPKPTPKINWNTIKSGDMVTLYRGENQSNTAGGNWWTTNPKKAKQYGKLRSFSVLADDLGKVSVQGHGGIDEFYFPNGVPSSFLSKPYKLTVSQENALDKAAWNKLKKASKITQETVDTFRTALGNSILNTVMSATPADKPMAVSGRFRIPYKIGKQFGLEEDPMHKGYSIIQSQFLGLPFQFYNYALANANKTIAAFAHGQLKNQLFATSMALSFGYMSTKLRTPEFAWDEMSYPDRFARAFDASGLLSIYSGLFYTGLHTSLALGGPNISGGIINPKFPVQPDTARGVVGLLGAGPSIGFDIGAGAYELMFGDNRGEGAKQIVRNLPYARLWFWKDQMNAMTRAWGL